MLALLMSNKPFILLTGDDSIRAEGLILVKRIVEKFADYQIIATKTTQSAVGGALRLKGGDWGREIVDGHEAIWVDAYPSDAMYFAAEYLQRKPDLVISGVNHGDNVENLNMMRSGTVAAAITAAVHRDFKAIALSLRINTKDWFKDHDGSFNEKLLEYPGELIEKIVKLALDYDIPEHTFWNVNFPADPTNKLRVVKTNNFGSYSNEQEITNDKFGYTYHTRYDDHPEDTDSGLLERGYASITPCKLEYTDFPELEKLGNFIADNS